MTKKKTTPKIEIEVEEKIAPKIAEEAIPTVEEKTVKKQSVQSKNQTNQSGV